MNPVEIVTFSEEFWTVAEERFKFFKSKTFLQYFSDWRFIDKGSFKNLQVRVHPSLK